MIKEWIQKNRKLHWRLDNKNTLYALYTLKMPLIKIDVKEFAEYVIDNCKNEKGKIYITSKKRNYDRKYYAQFKYGYFDYILGYNVEECRIRNIIKFVYGNNTDYIIMIP